MLLGEPWHTWGSSGPLSNLVSLHLADHLIITCAAPSYLKARASVREPHDLLQHDCLAMVSADGATTKDWRFVRGQQRLGIEIRLLLAVNDGPALVDASVPSQGIVHLPAINLASRLVSGELLQLRPDWHSAAPPITAVFAESARKATRLRVFVQFLQVLFADDAPGRPLASSTSCWPVRHTVKRQRVLK